MVVDFAKVNVKEQPLLILQNMDDTPIGVLKYAFNVEADLCYNEVSTLSFELPVEFERLRAAPLILWSMSLLSRNLCLQPAHITYGTRLRQMIRLSE